MRLPRWLANRWFHHFGHAPFFPGLRLCLVAFRSRFPPCHLQQIRASGQENGHFSTRNWSTGCLINICILHIHMKHPVKSGLLVQISSKSEHKWQSYGQKQKNANFNILPITLPFLAELIWIFDQSSLMLIPFLQNTPKVIILNENKGIFYSIRSQIRHCTN